MDGLSKDNKQQLSDIFKQIPSLQKAVLFGSRAMGLHRHNSDVDIALYGDKLTLRDILKINFKIEETTMPYIFDFVLADGINEALQEHIAQHGQEMYVQQGEGRLGLNPKLSDVCVGGGSYGISASAVPFSEDLPTYLRITDINDDGTLDAEGLKSVDDPKSHKYQLKPNDIVFARTGASTGRNYFNSGDDGEFVYAGFLIKFSVDPGKVNPRFIKYYCQSKEYRDWVNSFNAGSTRGNMNAVTLSNMSIPNIPRVQQDLLSDTLSVLDDKIENNNKINQHLEQMAQAIFKSWFVDFEPWGGTMPADWRKGNLLEIADYLNGLAMQKFRPTDEEIGLPVLKIKELRLGSCDSTSEFCSPNIRPEFIVRDGDVIFSWSGSLVVDFWCGGVCGLNQHLFKVTSPKFDKWFYYLWTRHHLDHFIAIAADKATTMGHIKRSALADAEVCIPSKNDYAVVGALLEPLCDQVINNRIENRKLALLRDTLLPRLMSGEIKLQ
ncbi:MAG: restriction endonuclease subunit S [Defluviitaleaceae bacterium]|nr:restriction endonuclease subunit S [Defluviitaleaceae bacterium]